mmetsp:Transcript_32599/g.28859  ORF Transcript_32599/g.28859 Transcript_32599/m.28859 type:complete len:151 (-) Transcript_32599:469-921(-)
MKTLLLKKNPFSLVATTVKLEELYLLIVVGVEALIILNSFPRINSHFSLISVRDLKKGGKRVLKINKDGTISKDLINRVYEGSVFKIPYMKDTKQKECNRSLEAIIYKKFNNRKSVNKILQKTAKLQKNLDQKLYNITEQEETTGDIIRH